MASHPAAATAPTGGVFPPQTIQQWQAIRQSFAATHNKNYGGTRGDSAFINWALAILEIGAATTIIVFSFTFLSAMASLKGKSQQNFSTVYYCSQFVFGLSILTVSVFTLYVLWVFADSMSNFQLSCSRSNPTNIKFSGRHPMRKAWVKMAGLQEQQQRALQLEQARQTGDPALVGNNLTRGQVRTADGGNVAFPGMGTMGFEGVNRLTVDRLYAERKHIQKLTALYGILFIAVSTEIQVSSVRECLLSCTMGSGLYHS